jgi:ankyrin repeat protein
MPRTLPAQPSLDHLRAQARALLTAYRDGDGDAYARISASFPKLKNASARDIRDADFRLQHAQLVVAREYGFDSWTKLREYVDACALGFEHAIRTHDIPALRRMLAERPGLLSSDVRSESDSLTALAFACQHGSLEAARAVLDAGYDINVDGDPLFQAALTRQGGNMPLAELLVAHGVKPRDNAAALFQLTENLDAAGVRWMLERGADPDYRTPGKEQGIWTPLDNAIHTYLVDPAQRQEVIRALLDAGAKHEDSALFDLLAGRIEPLRSRLDAQPALVRAHFDIQSNRVTSLEFGGHYGGAPLKQTTLLHHCAEFGFVEEAALLIERGADVNGRANPAEGAYSNHTPVFHAVTTSTNNAFPVLELLLAHGADVNAKASVDLFVWARDRRGGRHRMQDVTPLAYIRRFPNKYWKSRTPGAIEERTDLDTEPHASVVALLQRHGAVE